MQQIQIIEDFFNEEKRKTLLKTSPRTVKENCAISSISFYDKKKPIDAAVKESQLVALQEEIMILKDRLALAEADNEFLRKGTRKEDDKTSCTLECVSCKNSLCSGSDVLKTIEIEELHTLRRPKGEQQTPWCLSTDCFKDNVIVGSAKDALILAEVFHASPVFCNTCLVEVGYCFAQNRNKSIFQTLVKGLYIFKSAQIKSC